MRIIKIILSFVIILNIFVSGSIVSAQCGTNGDQLCNLKDAFGVKDGKNTDPLDSAALGAGYDIRDAENQLTLKIALIINVLLSFLGVLFMLLMIYGGYIWMIAKGNDQEVTKAKQTITAAVIGLIIVLSAYAISFFVVEKLTSVTIGQ